MDHTQHIKSLITERGYKSYLEIGYGKGHNFNAIEVKEKTAVDPIIEKGGEMLFEGNLGNPDKSRVLVSKTSDAYFGGLVHNKKFDCVFVDGSHLADQVERDIVNAWKHLKKGGCIVLHDINPSNEQMARVPREIREWCGTVYQAWDGIKTAYPRLITQQFTDDYGIGIIEYSADIKIEPGFVSNITFDEYKAKYFA